MLFFGFIHHNMTDKKHLQTLRVTVRVGVCVTLRSALSVAMAIVADAFANLIDYLEREEAVLKTLGATDLRACLRTGCGTHGHTRGYRALRNITKF